MSALCAWQTSHSVTWWVKRFCTWCTWSRVPDDSATPPDGQLDGIADPKRSLAAECSTSATALLTLPRDSICTTAHRRSSVGRCAAHQSPHWRRSPVCCTTFCEVRRSTLTAPDGVLWLRRVCSLVSGPWCQYRTRGGARPPSPHILRPRCRWCSVTVCSFCRPRGRHRMWPWHVHSIFWHKCSEFICHFASECCRRSVGSILPE